MASRWKDGPSDYDDVLEYIEERNHVSFGELSRRFSALVDGDQMYGKADFKTWFYVNLSNEFLDKLDSWIEARKVHLWPTNAFVYLIDGGMPKLPIAKRPGHKYKKDRWLPVVINVGPRPSTK